MKITYLFLLILLYSCNKFEHHEPAINASCELCELADQMEGLYSGEMRYYLNTPVGYPDSIRYDSVFIDVTHIFINENPYHDSTVMYFHFTKYTDSLTDPNPETLLVHASDFTSNLWNSYYKEISLNYDSLKLSHFESHFIPQGYGSYSLSYSGTLYR